MRTTVFAEGRRAVMEQPGSPGQANWRSHQLVLPFPVPEPRRHPPPLPVATVRTRHVWASLGQTGQTQLRQVLLRIVQEVLHERSA